MTEDAELVIDYDQVAFQAASALETKLVQVKHLPSGNVKEFKNKTEFCGRSKKVIGGWLGDVNSKREQEGKSPFPLEDFEIESIQKAPDKIAFTFQAAKTKALGISEYLKIPNYSGVIGVGKTFRHVLSLPKEYKSENRDVKPIQLDETKDFLVNFQNGSVVGEIEADDALEIKAFAGWRNYIKTGKFNYIIASIDKDSLHTPGLLFNFYKEPGSGKYKQPEIIFIDDSIGDIWIKEVTNDKGKVNKDIKGWGSYWLAYQLLCGDSTDVIRPYQDFDIKFGDLTCYEYIKDSKSQYDLFEKVRLKYAEWFPDGVKYTSWDGKDVDITSDEWLEMIFKLVYMRRTYNDKTTFADMLKHYKKLEEVV